MIISLFLFFKKVTLETKVYGLTPPGVTLKATHQVESTCQAHSNVKCACQAHTCGPMHLGQIYHYLECAWQVDSNVCALRLTRGGVNHAHTHTWVSRVMNKNTRIPKGKLIYININKYWIDNIIKTLVYINYRSWRDKTIFYFRIYCSGYQHYKIFLQSTKCLTCLTFDKRL